MPEEKDSQTRPGIKTLLGWVKDSHNYFRQNRQEQWRDYEMYDGLQWSADQAMKLREMLGMQALTINRTFPTLNMLLGMHALSKTDIIAKGRSTQDTDLSSLASESIKFVMDQNEGGFKITDAFKGAIIPGFSCIEVLKNADPRKEVVKWALRSWKEMWWDPHGSPWFDTDNTRYVFHQKWVDLQDLLLVFPNHKEEILGYYTTMGSETDLYTPTGFYEGFVEDTDEEEEYWRSQIWVDRQRKRIQPVQLWYTIKEKVSFVTFPDGTAKELSDKIPITEQYELIMAGQEVVTGIVPRMRVATFVGNVLLQDAATPHVHDEFPYAPFVGYLDRFRLPYGVPRQIRDMDVEVNKRRTTALAKMNARRVIVEEGAVDDYQSLREEAMRPDGLIIVKKGKVEMVRIEDHTAELTSQIALLESSEREIQETSGAIAEQMGIQSNAVSGVAIQNRQQRGATVTAPLFDNSKRSKKRLGTLTIAEIQQQWSGEKIIRITDRRRGVDKLVVVNERQQEGKIKNNITQGRYDIVITDDIQTDVLREKYAEMLIEWTKRAAPEAVPIIIDIVFEMLDIPNKEIILMRLRQAFNLDVPSEDIDKEQIAKQIQEQRAKQAETQAKMEGLSMEEQQLKNEKLIAQIREIIKKADLEDAMADKTEAETEEILNEDDRADESHEREMKTPIGVIAPAKPKVVKKKAA